MDCLFLFLLTGKYLSRYSSWLYRNILLRKNILFYFSITKCSLTVRKRKSQLAICHYFDGDSMYYFGPQESIWEPPSRSEHYKEKCVVCGCSWSSYEEFRFLFQKQSWWQNSSEYQFLLSCSWIFSTEISNLRHFLALPVSCLGLSSYCM